MQALLDQFAQAARFVGSDRQQHRFTSGLLDLHGQGITVGVTNLRRADFRIDIDDLVAGGEHCDARTTKHLQLRFSHGGGEGNGGLVEMRPAVEQKAAVFGFGSLRDNVFSRRNLFCEFDALVLRDVYSIITTASAPCGTGAPVMMENVSPGFRVNGPMRAEAGPALISPITFSLSWKLFKSAARTA